MTQIKSHMSITSPLNWKKNHVSSFFKQKKCYRKDIGKWEIWFEVVKPKLENRLNQGNSRGQRAGSISEDQCVATLLIPRLQGPHPIHTTDSAPGHSSTHLPVSQSSPCICIICSRPKSQIGVMGLAESRSIACPAGLGIQGQNFSTFWILQWKVGHYIPRR